MNVYKIYCRCQKRLRPDFVSPKFTAEFIRLVVCRTEIFILENLLQFIKHALYVNSNAQAGNPRCVNFKLKGLGHCCLFSVSTFCNLHLTHLLINELNLLYCCSEMNTRALLYFSLQERWFHRGENPNSLLLLNLSRNL